MSSLTEATLMFADRHPLFLKGLAMSLQDDFLIVGIAVDGKKLMELLKARQPDIILLDLQTPYMEELDTVEYICNRFPEVRLIILSVLYDKELELRLKKLGVKGYLSKDIQSDCLVGQIKNVLQGGLAFHEPKQEIQFNNPSKIKNAFLAKYNLSSRELEVVSLIRQGLTSNEIAKNLYISVNTVEAHRKHIFKKLQLRNIQGIVEFAFKHSL